MNDTPSWHSLNKENLVFSQHNPFFYQTHDRPAQNQKVDLVHPLLSDKEASHVLLSFNPSSCQAIVLPLSGLVTSLSLGYNQIEYCSQYRFICNLPKFHFHLHHTSHLSPQILPKVPVHQPNARHRRNNTAEVSQDWIKMKPFRFIPCIII